MIRLPVYAAQQPITDFGLQFTGLILAALVPTAVDTIATIPNNASRYKAVISADIYTPIWVALNQVATPPTSPTFTLWNSELINSFAGFCRDVVAGDELHFWVESGPLEISIALYVVNTN